MWDIKGSAGFEACLTVAALLSGSAAAGQARDVDPLAGVTRLECTFRSSSAASWANGEPRLDIRRGIFYSFRLDDIDTVGGTARFAYGAASTTVAAVAQPSTVSFVDRRADGTMMLTTVFARRGTDGPFRAVHARSEYYAYDGPGFSSVPQSEQYYGACTTVP